MRGLRRRDDGDGDHGSYDALDVEACVMRVMETRLESLRQELASEPCAGCAELRQRIQQAAGLMLDTTRGG